MTTRTLPSIDETQNAVSTNAETIAAPKATLINAQGQKVVVDGTPGNQEAKQYFGQGYTLDTSGSQTSPTATPTTFTPDAATATTTPTVATPASYSDAMKQVITAGAGVAKDAVYGDLSNNFDNQLLVQRGLIYASLAGERLTPSELQVLSPSQQAAVRGASKEALQAEIIGMNSILQGRETLKDKEAEKAQKQFDLYLESGVAPEDVDQAFLAKLDETAGTPAGTYAAIYKSKFAVNEAEIQDALVESASKLNTYLNTLPIGQEVTIDGVTYTSLNKGKTSIFQQDDGNGTLRVYEYNEDLKQVSLISTLTGVSSVDGWTTEKDDQGRLWRINANTNEHSLVFDGNEPNGGIATGGILELFPEGSISPIRRHKSGTDAYNIWLDAQCGSWTNDMTGVGVGDTWESKQAKMTNSVVNLSTQDRLSHAPSVGDVFVQTITTNNLGHVGIVNAVTPIYGDDGSIIDYQLTLSESNWKTTKDADVLRANGIDPSILSNSQVAQRGVGIITHTRTMKLSDKKLTGFASVGFKDPRYNFSGTDSGESPTFGGEAPADPIIKSINGVDMQYDPITRSWITPIGTDEASAAENAAKIQTYTDKISAIDTLLTSPGFTGAVGPNDLARDALSLMEPFTSNISNFIAGVDQIVSGLTITELQSAKAQGATFGALSDSELHLLAAAATKINSWALHEDKNDPTKVTGYKTTEAAFKTELDTIRNYTQRGIEASGGATTIRVKDKATGQTGTIDASEFDSNLYEKL